MEDEPEKHGQPIRGLDNRCPQGLVGSSPTPSAWVLPGPIPARLIVIPRKRPSAPYIRVPSTTAKPSSQVSAIPREHREFRRL